MKTQLWLLLVIVFGGAGALLAECLLVRWYPRHQQRVADEVLTLLPYRNDSLGVEMQVAAGIYGKVDGFPGGVKIYRSKFWSVGPSLTITSQPNPDNAAEFSPQILAKWESQGAIEEIPRYHFERTKINNRDAVLISRLGGRTMLLTAHVISPERVVEADCNPGLADEDLYMQACQHSVETIRVAGPEPPPPVQQPELIDIKPRHRATR
jgi:hypothetical protein